jgi:methionine-rich copper-binding protein CopC
VRRWLAVVAGTGLLLATLAPAALAHAAYKDSNPADGSTVSGPPSEVWAEFTEPPTDDEASRLEVYDPCGARVDTGGTTASGYRLITAMSADKQGKYTVVFQVVSRLDGHPTKGQFTFTSTGGAPCPGSAEETEQPEEPEEASGDGGSSDDGETDQPTEIAGSDDEPFDPVDALKGHGKHEKKKKAKKKARAEKKETEDAEDEGLVAATPPTTPAGDSQPMPMDWLLISFGIAALIGAAGGQIYVNLLGPKR